MKLDDGGSVDMFDQPQHYYTTEELCQPALLVDQAPPPNSQLDSFHTTPAYPGIPYSPGYSESLFPLDALLQDPSFPTEANPAHPACALGTPYSTHTPTTSNPPTNPFSPTTSDDLFAESFFGPQQTPEFELSLPAHESGPLLHPSVGPSTHPDAPSPNAFPSPVHPYPPHPLTEIDALLQNPLNTALISAQRSRPTPKRTAASKPPPSSRHTTTAPSVPIPPITKPPPKKKKFRPADRINNLQRHVATIAGQVDQLSLHNRLLNRKHQILHHLVQDLNRFEALADQIQSDISHHRAHPSQPPRGAALFQAWTPEFFADFHNAQLQSIAQLLLASDSSQPLPAAPSPSAPSANPTPAHLCNPSTALPTPSSLPTMLHTATQANQPAPSLMDTMLPAPPAAVPAKPPATTLTSPQRTLHPTTTTAAMGSSGPPPGSGPAQAGAAPEVVATQATVLAELAAANQQLMQTTLYVCYGRMSFIPRVMKLLSESQPLQCPEEEHWHNVLDAMQLSEEQAEVMLVAREVFLHFTSKLEQEQDVAQAAIRQESGFAHPAQAAARTGMLDEKIFMEEHVIRRVAVLLRRHHSLLLLLTLFIFVRTLTPVQVARCALQAHPLLPEPIIMMNVLHAQRVGPPAGPVLGPQLPLAATVRTMADLL